MKLVTQNSYCHGKSSVGPNAYNVEVIVVIYFGNSFSYLLYSDLVAMLTATKTIDPNLQQHCAVSRRQHSFLVQRYCTDKSGTISMAHDVAKFFRWAKAVPPCPSLLSIYSLVVHWRPMNGDYIKYTAMKGLDVSSIYS